MKKRVWDVLEFVMGVSILAILLYKIGVRDVYATLLKSSGLSLVIAFLVLVLVLVLGGLNIKIFTNVLGYRVSAKEIIRKYMFNWVISQVLPLRLASISLVFLLQRAKIKMKDGMAVVFVDKIITFVMLSLLTIGALLYFFPLVHSLKYILFFIVFLGVIMFFTFSVRLEVVLLRIFKRLQVERIAGFANTAKKLIRKRKMVVLNGLLTLVKLFITALIPYVILIGFGVRVQLFEFFLISIMITTIASLPITTAGLGVREWGAVTLYSTLMRIDPVVITSTYLLFLFLKYVLAVIFLGGLIRKFFTAISRSTVVLFR